MPHDTTLIATIAVGLTAALIGGIIATKLRLPPLVGYLLAGVAVGPFTPGFVADAHLAPQLAEVGVILLMFGVGIHFSPADLLKVRRLALPGAIGQVTVATILGLGVARLWGWSFGEGLVFGLALSVASTVVLLRALEARGAVSSPEGGVAVGWVIVQDLVMVLALVLLPALAGPLGGTATNSDDSLLLTLTLTLGKVVLFGVVMFVAGIRVIPWLLAWIEQTGSRELFVLSILAAALGIAYGAAELFGVSFALGAFLAGVIVNESEFSHRAAEEALPLREAFAVLFFVSVGMLIDPGFLIDHLDRILIVSALIIIGTGCVALTIVRALGGSLRTGLIVAAGVSQIGEFSFILAELGIGLNLLPHEGRDLILAGALVSITLSPLVWRAADLLTERAQVRQAAMVGV